MCPSGINDFPMTNASHIKVCFVKQEILDQGILDDKSDLPSKTNYSSRVNLLAFFTL